MSRSSRRSQPLYEVRVRNMLHRTQSSWKFDSELHMQRRVAFQLFTPARDARGKGIQVASSNSICSANRHLAHGIIQTGEQP